MPASRCPQCQLPLTDSEAQTGVCPVCASPLGEPTTKLPGMVPPPSPARGQTSILTQLALVAILLLTGGLGGYFLRPLLAAEPERPPATPTGEVGPAPQPAADSGDRLRELESLTTKLAQDLAAAKQQAAAALAQQQAARSEAEKARDEAQSLTNRVKDLLVLTSQLRQEQELLKKQAAEAHAAEIAARRPPAPVLAPQPPKAQADRSIALELLVKKLQKEVESQRLQLTASQNREAAARRETEQIRQAGQQLTEQVRQQGQRALEQVRQESQRQLEQVRQQLRQQELATQQARAEAERQKRAAEEARRKASNPQ